MTGLTQYSYSPSGELTIATYTGSRKEYRLSDKVGNLSNDLDKRSSIGPWYFHREALLLAYLLALFNVEMLREELKTDIQPVFREVVRSSALCLSAHRGLYRPLTLVGIIPRIH